MLVIRNGNFGGTGFSFTQQVVSDSASLVL